jgi:hypothetical protein
MAKFLTDKPIAVVDEVAENLDQRMAALHGAKIDCARGVCDSLYEGFHVVEMEEEEEAVA